MEKPKVALVGHGSQGSRIATAISNDPNIHLYGITLKKPDTSAFIASRKGYQIYAINEDKKRRFSEVGIEVQGILDDLLSNVDIVIDTTPKGVGKTNKKIYSDYGVKAIFQGGEEFDVADIPVFISQISFKEAKQARYLRIPTPYTVSLYRTLAPVDKEFGIKEIQCTFIIPGSEPMRGKSGPVDTIIPREISQVHFIKNEFLKIMPKSLVLSFFRISSLLLGVASIIVELEREISVKECTDVLSTTERTIIVDNKGLNSTDAVFEYIRRMGRYSVDIYENCIWKEQIEPIGTKLKIVQAFDHHCVQTPEVLDAIRALKGKINLSESLERTNSALGILPSGLHP